MPEKMIRLGGVDVDVGPLLSDPAARKAFAQVLFEIQDPMHAIVGFSEVLIAELAPIASSQHLQHLRYIHQSASFLLQIRNDLLAAGRGAYEAERQQSNIVQATRDVARKSGDCDQGSN
jgi:signal transduction histidine kinase